MQSGPGRVKAAVWRLLGGELGWRLCEVLGVFWPGVGGCEQVGGVAAVGLPVFPLGFLYLPPPPHACLCSF